MKRRIVQWSVEKVYQDRDKYIQADYQRNPKLWTLADKQLLIDSILTDIDIPKMYLNEIAGGQYEIVDGQQRLYAIWGFINNEFKYKGRELIQLDGKYFDKFPTRYRDKILNYELQFTIIKNADDQYLRTLFLRLQLGLLLVAGEKLKAETGEMRDFIFAKMVNHPFIQAINIPNRRFAKQALCAQICINSFKKAKVKTFSRTRYEDLYYFFREYRDITGPEKEFFDERCQHIIEVLGLLNKHFKNNAGNLRNRSLILSIYLLIEEFYGQDKNALKKAMPLFVSFVMKLIERLKEEAGLGIHRRNEDLYRLESFLSNAPGEKYQIEKRHKHISKLFDHFQKTGKIKGDK